MNLVAPNLVIDILYTVFYMHCTLKQRGGHAIAVLSPCGNSTLLTSLFQSFQLPPQGGVGGGCPQQIKAIGIARDLKKDTKVKATCRTPPFTSCWVQSTPCNSMTH